MSIRKKILLIPIISLTFIIGVCLAFQYWLNQKAKAVVDETIQHLSPYAQISYTDVSAHFWTGALHIKHVRIFPQQNALLPLYIRDMGIKAEQMKNGILKHVKLSLHGVDIPTEFFYPYPLAHEALRYAGQNKISGDIFLDYNFNPSQKNADLLFLTSLKNWGTLQVYVLCQPYQPGSLTSLDWYHLPFLKFKLIYQEETLASVLFAVLGAKEGKTSEEYQRKITDSLNPYLAQYTDIKTKNSLITLREFIERPHQIRLTLINQKPLSLSQLQELQMQGLKTGSDLQILS